MDTRSPWTDYAIKLRWLTLLTIGLWGLLCPRWVEYSVPTALGALVLLGALYNAVVWMLGRRGFTFSLTLPALLVDMILVAVAVQNSGGAHSPLFFLYLAPLVFAAMLYSLVGFATVLAATALLHVTTATALSGDFASAHALLLFHCLFFAFAGLLLLRVAGERLLGESELQGMENVARAFAARRDRLTAVPEVLRAAAEAAGAAWVGVFTATPQTGVLQCWPEDASEAFPLGSRATELAGAVVQSGEAAVVRWTDEPLGPVARPQRVACIPLGPRGAAKGVLLAATASSFQPLSPKGVGLLKLIAGELSLLVAEQDESALVQSLSAQSRMVDTLLRHLDSAVLVADLTGRIAAVNPAVARLLRVNPEGLRGRPMHEAVPHKGVARLLERVVDSRVPESSEVVLGADEELTVRVDASPVLTDETGLLGYVVVFTNVTELRRLDSMKSQFVAALSHELRTPLTSIKAYTATLLRDVEFDPDTQREFLAIVNTQCDRLTELINDLLDVSNLDAGKSLELDLTEVRLKELLTKVIDGQRGLTDRHSFSVTVNPDACAVRADAHRLQQVLTNLLSNAVKYSPEGGEIRLYASAVGDTVNIEVTDQGMGIDPSYQEAIFDRFFQVDGSTTRRVGGSGTGLYLLKHLVRAHGGTVSVESALGEGSTFTVHLPRNGPAEVR